MVIGMQTTGESALKNSQDFDEVQSILDEKDSAEDEEFISSPAMTLQNVILKCFPSPPLSTMPLKQRREYKRKMELHSLRSGIVNSTGKIVWFI